MYLVFTLFAGCMYIVLLAKEIAITTINITSDFMLACRLFRIECETSPIQRRSYTISPSVSYVHIICRFQFILTEWRAHKAHQLVDTNTNY